MSLLRLIWTGLWLNLKMLSTSGFFLLTSSVQPVIFATIAFYMFQAGGRAGTLLYAALGAGMMGIWSTTLFASGGMIQWQRWQGTLELGVAAPPPLVLIYMPFCFANAIVGGYSLAATLLWGRLLFGVPLHLAHPLEFAIAVPAAIISLGLIGLVLASTFVLYRTRTRCRTCSSTRSGSRRGSSSRSRSCPSGRGRSRWLLPPYWGIHAIRHSALGGPVWFPLAMLAVLGAAAVAVASVTMRWFEYLARARATLSLT